MSLLKDVSGWRCLNPWSSYGFSQIKGHWPGGVNDLWSVSSGSQTMYNHLLSHDKLSFFYICMKVYWDILTIGIGHCSVNELQKSVWCFSAQLFSVLSYYKAYFPIGVLIQYLSTHPHCCTSNLKKQFHNCWVLAMVQWCWTITYL